MRQNFVIFAVTIVVLLMLLALSVFVVDQRQNAIVFKFGEIISVKKQPGLYFKWPVIENIRYFDNRVLTIETPDPEQFLTSEKKNVLVDLYVKWRIADVSK